MWVLSQRSSRACTASRDAPVSCSSAMTRSRGRSTSSPGDQLADRRAGPAHRAVGRQHELAVGRLRELGGARVDLAGQRRARRALQASWPRSPPADASATKVKPSSRPISWPSTTTSPVFLISVSNVVFSRSRRINTLVRRSTNRSVRRSCSASESLSSTLRATACQCSGSASQSGRFATKVQVRTCAIRFESVSISPSVRSACATWAENQSTGILPSRIRNP